MPELQGFCDARFAPMRERLQPDLARLPEEEWMADVMPGANAMTNARALARISAIIAGQGEVDGRRYLTPGAVEEVGREQRRGFDELMGATMRRGLHFALSSGSFPAPTPTTVRWGGQGGSWVTMDPASGISAAYVPNRLRVGDPWLLRQAGQWQAFMEALVNVGLRPQ